MRLPRARGLVCVVTDRRRLLPHAPPDAQLAAVVAQATAAAQADVDLFQIRERELDDRRLHGLVCDVVAVTAGSAMRILVNDRLDVALSAGAHGVHLPESGLAVAGVRALAPAGWLTGQSLHGAAAAHPDTDYVIYGTVFPTASKAADYPWAGVDALAMASRRTPAPVLAIGGITRETVGQVAAVSSGVAAIGWLATTDPARLSEAVHAVRKAFDTITPVI